MGKSKVIKLKGSNVKKAEANEIGGISEAEVRNLNRAYLFESILAVAKEELYNATFNEALGNEELRDIIETYLNIYIDAEINKLRTLLRVRAGHEIEIRNPNVTLTRLNKA